LAILQRPKVTDWQTDYLAVTPEPANKTANH